MKTASISGALLLGILFGTSCRTHYRYEGDRYRVQRDGQRIATHHHTQTEVERDVRHVVVSPNATIVDNGTAPAPVPVPGPNLESGIGRIAAGVSLDDAELPPNAQPGECYARVYEPPQYRTVTERVMVQEPSSRIEIIPARYETVEERVLVREESTRLEVVPAEYEMREEEIVVVPATTRIEEVPAEYEWVEEQVLVKPAHTVWKRGNGLIERVDNATGEIMCLVEIPAEYKTVRRQKLISPATTRTIDVPAVTKKVQRRVMVRAPETRPVTIPAEYETMQVQKIVQPEERRQVPIEARYEEVQREVIVTEGRNAWRRVLCETNMSAELCMRVQEALRDAGYDPGAIDGKLGPATLAAVKKFQEANRLAVGGLTYQTLEALNITP